MVLAVLLGSEFQSCDSFPGTMFGCCAKGLPANDGFRLLPARRTTFWSHARLPLSVSDPHAQGSTQLTDLWDRGGMRICRVGRHAGVGKDHAAFRDVASSSRKGPYCIFVPNDIHSTGSLAIAALRPWCARFTGEPG